MTTTNFAVQYSNVNVSEVSGSGHDMLITEALPLAGTTAGILTDAEVAQLGAEGISVIGYISIGQTDHTRPYWDSAWTIDPATDADGTNDSDPWDDTAALSGSAPAWIAEVATSWPARFVKYWDTDWQDIVFAQIDELISRGYDGVFLDNVLSYYEMAAEHSGTYSSTDLAQKMIDFIIAISVHAKAQDPNFKIIPNGGPYVIGDSGDYAGNATAYLAAIDAIMSESQYGLYTEGVEDQNTAALGVYENPYVANGVEVLALEYSTNQAETDAFVADAQSRGFAVSVSPDFNLNSLPAALIDTSGGGDTGGGDTGGGETGGGDTGGGDTGGEGGDTGGGDTGDGSGDTTSPPLGNHEDGTSGDDEFSGTQYADSFSGRGGDDLMRGGQGEDDFRGGGGDDKLFGGAQDDILRGNKGADILRGGAGDDLLLGGAGPDRMFGQGGDDTMRGAGGNDHMSGGAGRDLVTGGGGHDKILGGGKNDVLNGGRGDDLMRAGRGSDTLNAGAGNDEMAGGAGADTFVFKGNFGYDVIFDFDTAQDSLQLVNTGGYTASEVDGNLVLDFGNGEITLEGVTLADFGDVTIL